MRKYINIYIRRNFLLALFCSIIIFIPLFIVSLIYDVISYDIAVSFTPFVLSFLCVLFSNFSTIKFKKMITQQETMYNIEFNDNSAQHLETTLYLSDNWLIYAGISAFCKNHIRSIRTKVECGKAGTSKRIIIETVNNKKYAIWCVSDENARNIEKWLKET